jgi:hypothetical protein
MNQTRLQKKHLEYSRELLMLHAGYLAELRKKGIDPDKTLRVFDGRWRKKCYEAKKVQKLILPLDAFSKLVNNDEANKRLSEMLEQPIDVLKANAERSLSVWDKVKRFFKRSKKK